MTSLADLTHKTLSRMENRALHHILQQQRLHIPGEPEPFEQAGKKLLGGAVRSLLAHASSPSPTSPSPHPTAAAAPSPSPTAALTSQQDLDLYLEHEVSSPSLGPEPDRRSRLSVCMPAKKRASGGYAAAQASRSETPLQLLGAHEAVQRLPPRCVSCVPTLQGESSCPALLFTSGPCPPAHMPPRPGGSSSLNRTNATPGPMIPDPTYSATPAEAVLATAATSATPATAALMGSSAAPLPGPSYSPSPSVSGMAGAAPGATLPAMFPARSYPSSNGSGGSGGNGGGSDGSLVSRHSLPMLPPSLKIPGQGMGTGMSSLASEARRSGSPVTPSRGAERSAAGRPPLAPHASVGGGRSPMGHNRVRVAIGAQGVPSCSMLPALPAAVSLSPSERAAPAARLRASPKP